MALSLLAFAAQMTASNITGLSLYGNAGGCYDTVQDGNCTPVGVTSTSNQTLLNNLTTSAIHLTTGSYYLYLQPFFSNGSVITLTISYDDRPDDIATFMFGQPFVAANYPLISGPSSITIGNTGIGDRDLMNNFAEAPSGFGANSSFDDVLQLDVAVPEPSNVGLTLVGLGVFMVVSRRRDG